MLALSILVSPLAAALFVSGNNLCLHGLSTGEGAF